MEHITILFSCILFAVFAQNISAQLRYTPRKIQPVDRTFLHVPEKYKNADMERLYKGLDWVVETVNKDDVRALFYYPYADLFGRGTDKDMSGFEIECYYYAYEPKDKFTAYFSGFSIRNSEGIQPYSLRLGFSADGQIKSVREQRLGFVWDLVYSYDPILGEKDSVKEYFRRDLLGLIGESWVDGELKYEMSEPIFSGHMEYMIKALPELQKVCTLDFKKGIFFQREQRRVHLSIPRQGKYPEVELLLNNIQKYCDNIAVGNPGPLIENPVFAKQNFLNGRYPAHIVNLHFYEDFISDAYVELNTGPDFGYYLSLNREGNPTRYVEGDLLETDPTEVDSQNPAKHRRQMTVNGTGRILTFYSSGYPATYTNIVKNRLFGRQIEWNVSGDVISDVDQDIPIAWKDAPKNEEGDEKLQR